MTFRAEELVDIVTLCGTLSGIADLNVRISNIREPNCSAFYCHNISPYSRSTFCVYAILLRFNFRPDCEVS